MNDVADRLPNRVQLTTDGHKAYLSAVENAFGSNADYTALEKHSRDRAGRLGGCALHARSSSRASSSTTCAVAPTPLSRQRPSWSAGTSP